MLWRACGSAIYMGRIDPADTDVHFMRIDSSDTIWPGDSDDATARRRQVDAIQSDERSEQPSDAELFA